MMKKSFSILVTLLMVSFGFAQNSMNQEIKTEKEILRKARTYGDPSVVVKSLYAIMALEGENSTYKDSLAYIYFSSRKYGPCFMVSKEVLERDPKHMDMLEMNGISLESLGALEKSAEIYTRLLALTNNNYHAYTLANLNYKMKRYEKAYDEIKKAEKLNDEGKYQVTFSINKNHTQQVELIAVIPYLKGLIEIKLNNNAAGKISLAKAIKIQPDFVLAKENLEGIEKETDQN